ncbi:unnamed protein product [Echinostoma caproni]|uniref:DUF4160 domain-containing protein n=1 Tax=Echinostoma caproni TaxID=27848 RepID=A0A183ATQ3_9TREM|nr:unnamed protein product [Echinostoma caproni]
MMWLTDVSRVGTPIALRVVERSTSLAYGIENEVEMTEKVNANDRLWKRWYQQTSEDMLCDLERLCQLWDREWERELERDRSREILSAAT